MDHWAAALVTKSTGRRRSHLRERIPGRRWLDKAQHSTRRYAPQYRSEIARGHTSTLA